MAIAKIVWIRFSFISDLAELFLSSHRPETFLLVARTVGYHSRIVHDMQRFSNGFSFWSKKEYLFLTSPVRGFKVIIHFKVAAQHS